MNNDDNIVNFYSTSIINIYKQVIKKYEENVSLISFLENSLNDLNHEIELGDPKDAYKGYLLYKEIRDIRIKRRIAKEENELLEDMYNFFKSPQGQGFKTKIQSIQGGSVRIRNAQRGRTYHPKCRSDLTIEGKHTKTKCFN